MHETLPDTGRHYPQACALLENLGTVLDMSEYITLQEAADRLRRSPRALRDAWKVAGAPAAYRPTPGGPILYRVDEIEQWLDAGAERPTVLEGAARARGPQRRPVAV